MVDRRVKLSNTDKENIIKYYNTNNFTPKELSEKYGVSTRMINYILNPESLERTLKRNRERKSVSENHLENVKRYNKRKKGLQG